MRTAKTRGESGFTLLEVLVASAILGITVAALMGGLSGSLRNLSRAEDYEKAVFVGRLQLNRLLVEPKLKPGRLEGRWDDQFRWEAEVQGWEPAGVNQKRPAEQPPIVAVLRVTVFWKGLSGEKSVTFETARYAPPS